MKSARKVLKPFETQILKETAKHGQQAGTSLARELTGYKGYGFQRWLKETTGDENFGLHPTNPIALRESYWARRLVADQTYLEFVSALEAIAINERRAIKAQEELKQRLLELMEARRGGAPDNELKLSEFLGRQYDISKKIPISNSQLIELGSA